MEQRWTTLFVTIVDVLKRDNGSHIVVYKTLCGRNDNKEYHVDFLPSDTFPYNELPIGSKCVIKACFNGEQIEYKKCFIVSVGGVIE